MSDTEFFVGGGLDDAFIDWGSEVVPTDTDAWLSSMGDTSDLGDTVGTAGSLVNLLKTGLSTGADILGGGDAKGGAGFVSQVNPVTEGAIREQMSQIYGRSSRQTTSPRGRGARNPHSDAIMRGFNQDALASFGRIITASRSGGQRVYAKPRESL